MTYFDVFGDFKLASLILRLFAVYTNEQIKEKIYVACDRLLILGHSIIQIGHCY